MKMGPAQKQAIATQHRRWNRSSEPTKARNPLTFERWFLIGVRIMEKRGAEFELFEAGMIKITWPGKPAILRTVEDFRREYETEYLSKFSRLSADLGLLFRHFYWKTVNTVIGY